QAGDKKEEEKEQAGDKEEEEEKEQPGDKEEEEEKEQPGDKEGEETQPETDNVKMGMMPRPGQLPPPGEMEIDKEGVDAVEEFDQQGDSADPENQDQSSDGEPEKPQSEGEEESRMMEQWLEQIEGDPVQLLRNQFMLEEQRLIQKKGGSLRESRPW
ncbi:MAG: hypothetical protein ABW148_08655, partial [Sedimenticola sp.]